LGRATLRARVRRFRVRTECVQEASPPGRGRSPTSAPATAPRSGHREIRAGRASLPGALRRPRRERSRCRGRRLPPQLGSHDGLPRRERDTLPRARPFLRPPTKRCFPTSDPRTTMMKFVLSLADVLRFRFAISPLGETVRLARALANPKTFAQGAHNAWLRERRPALEGVQRQHDLRPLIAVLAARREYYPDFLTPTPDRTVGEIAEEL